MEKKEKSTLKVLVWVFRQEKLNIVSFKMKNDNITIPKVNEKDESMKIFTDNSYNLESTTEIIAATFEDLDCIFPQFENRPWERNKKQSHHTFCKSEANCDFH